MTESSCPKGPGCECRSCGDTECTIREKRTIVILNGPPACGKDRIGYGLMEASNDWSNVTFKGGIFDAIKALCRLTGSRLHEQLVTLYEDRSAKDMNGLIVPDMSIRDIMIHTSEVCMKPLFGDAIFGEILGDKIKLDRDYVITDGGFGPEINALIKATELTHDVTVFRVHRMGCTFTGDSRQYVNSADINCPVFDLHHYENMTGLALTTIKTLIGEHDEETV